MPTSDFPVASAGAETPNPADEIGRPIVNYFASSEVAERYATDRPARQGRVMGLLRSVLGPVLPLGSALDVGCGTGQSTAALLSCADAIVGVDSSSEMLAQALQHPRIQYRKAHAEALPFPAARFDLVTVSSAYHWFDHERFLAEAARVLRAGKWLVLYKVGSLGRPVAQPAFDAWRRDVLKARYPRVAKNNEALTAERAAQFGFVELQCETVSHRESHSLEAYVNNLLTHSRFIRVIESGQESRHDVTAWLNSELGPFFPGGTAEFVHESRIHVLQRVTGA